MKKSIINRIFAALVVFVFVFSVPSPVCAQPEDDVISVAFLGDSNTWLPLQDDHFLALSEGKHNVVTLNWTVDGSSLSDHYDIWTERIKNPVYKKQVDEWDIVVMNQGALGYGLYPIYKELIDLFGENKAYYQVNCAPFLKSEEGCKIDPDTSFYSPMYPPGIKIMPFYSVKGTVLRNVRAPSNAALLEMKRISLEDWGLTIIMVDPFNFDQTLELNPNDLLWDDQYHPSVLYGYIDALALYCTVFDEPAIEQNNGFLDDEDIPGDTPEEKEAYMLMIKNMVQEMVDLQRLDTGADPGPAHTAGDVNGDSTVNSKDLTRLMKYLSGLQIEVNTPALDVNGDGEVNAKDLIRLMKFLSGADVAVF